MTVAELIEGLKNYPPTARVVADSIIGGCFLLGTRPSDNICISNVSDEDAVDLNPLCFTVVGFVETGGVVAGNDETCPLLIQFEHN